MTYISTNFSHEPQLVLFQNTFFILVIWTVQYCNGKSYFKHEVYNLVKNRIKMLKEQKMHTFWKSEILL